MKVVRTKNYISISRAYVYVCELQFGSERERNELVSTRSLRLFSLQSEQSMLCITSIGLKKVRERPRGKRLNSIQINFCCFLQCLLFAIMH
jgi:hypothetical protein